MVSAKFGGGDGSSKPLYKVTCARCDAPATMPEPTPGKSRMPAVNADGTTTIDADKPCEALAEGRRCGGKRVRVTLQF